MLIKKTEEFRTLNASLLLSDLESNFNILGSSIIFEISQEDMNINFFLLSRLSYQLIVHYYW